MDWYKKSLNVRAAYRRFDGYNINGPTSLIDIAQMFIKKEPGSAGFIIQLMLDYFYGNMKYWESTPGDLETAINGGITDILRKYDEMTSTKRPQPERGDFVNDDAYQRAVEEYSDKMDGIVSNMMEADPEYYALVKMRQMLRERRQRTE